MSRRHTPWIVACLACLVAGCADRNAPGAPAAATPRASPREPVAVAPTPAPAPPAPPAPSPATTTRAAPATTSALPSPSPTAPATRPSAAGAPASATEAPRGKPAPPLVPRAVVATATSSSQIALSWEQPPGPTAPAGYEVFRDGRPAGKGSEPRFTDDHLRPWSKHCYAVQAFDASGQRSARSPETCARTRDETPPTEPRGLKAEVRGVDAVALSWLASTDDDEVDAYQVLRGAKLLSTGKATAFMEPGLAPAREYCYAVRAIDRARNGSAPAGPVCVVIPDVTAPTVPSKVVAAADGEHAITVGWTASTDDVGVARYEVVTDDAARSSVAAPAQPGAREGGLAVATHRCYVVRACDAAGNCSAWAPPACATTPDLTPPTPPASPAAVAASDTAIELRWEASTDNLRVAGYEVLRGDAVVARTETGTTAREAGLQPARQYCYTVRARDPAGNASTSAKACATTPDVKPPTAPGRPAAVPVSSTQVFVAWDPSTDDVGVAGYEVYRGAALVAKVTATRAREHRLEASHEYCYTVRAVDAAGNRSSSAGPFCTVTASPAGLSAPSDLRVRRLSRTNILLQWEPSESKGVVYRVYAQGDRLAGLTAGNTFTPSGTFGAEPNCFRVAALDTNDRESPRSNEVCAAPAEGAQSSR